MLTRRHLRIKVMQALYAYESVGHVSAAAAEKKMLESFQRMEDLHIYQLSFLVEVFDLARRKLEEGKNKLLPSPEDLEPNTRFADNQAIEVIRNSKAYEQGCDRLHINWKDHYDLVRKALEAIKESDYYERYMDQQETGFEPHRQMARYVVTEFLSDFGLLKNIYEERSIYWDEDYYVVNMMLLETIAAIKSHSDGELALPGVFKDMDEQGYSEDREFAKELLRNTAVNAAPFRKRIIEKASNWEHDRIAKVDMILLKMALAELEHFPSIPVKVTMNEYIEISKYYSTPKSRVFINGVMESIILEMKEKGGIKKSGRGLREE